MWWWKCMLYYEHGRTGTGPLVKEIKKCEKRKKRRKREKERRMGRKLHIEGPLVCEEKHILRALGMRRKTHIEGPLVWKEKHILRGLLVCQEKHILRGPLVCEEKHILRAPWYVVICHRQVTCFNMISLALDYHS